GVSCMMGAVARPLVAQLTIPRDSLRALAFRAVSASASEHTCPMPVAIPDLSRVERMPVSPTDARGHYIQVVPPGCVNPLFRGPVAALSPRPPLREAPPLRPRDHLPMPRVYLVPWW
ncbi:MAG: hypothetical protein ABSB58_07740, partial [Gemmatimonadales bacterium]